ncbi:MAG TPA: hypothetical protein VM389_11775 [Phycisphaerae bacterium]|nr:hypothetical protein [Phycisphaerae bacterium]
MRVPIAALWLCVAAVAVLPAGEVELTEDPPVARPPTAGDVRGTISPAEKVQWVRAVSRVTGKTHQPDRWDAKSGEFLFKGLPGDATYDLCLRTADGRNLEGIDLDFVDPRLIRLAAERRKQLKLPPEPPHPFTPDDAKAIVQSIDEMKDFMDSRRALYVQGHGGRATALVECLRAREFYAQKGNEVIWRVELWYFEYHYGGWEQAQEAARVLRRVRIPHEQWKRISIEYFPELSVHVLPTGYAPPVEFKIPDKPDPSRGRIPTGGEKLKSQPYVRGLDVKPEPATQPAPEDTQPPKAPEKPKQTPAEES